MACAAAESVEPNESECSVCNERYKEPKLLPCGHLLCRHCLLTWMKTQDEARCPLCRDLIVSPKERQSQSLEDLVSGFPTDLSMELMLEADRILSKQHTCCVCEDVAATAMCLDCKDMLCQPCRKVHGKLSATKHHTVEDLSILTAEKVAANYSSPCSTHPGEIPKLFCPTHGASICLLCASSKHRSCPEVKDLEEKLEESHALLKQLMTTLVDGEQGFDRAINELDEHLHSIEKSAKAAITEIEKMCDELDALVKKNRQQLKEQVVRARSDIEEAVKEGRGLLLQRQTKLSTHRPTVRRVGEAKNREVVTTMALKMEQRVKDLNYDITLPKDAKVISSFRFIKNSAAMTQIKQELGKLGEVKMEAANVSVNGKVLQVESSQVKTGQVKTGQARSSQARSSQVRSSQKVEFVFHDNHGTKVTLSNGNRTVSKSGDFGHGIVLSRDPLHVNHLYEVQIDQCPGGPFFDYSLVVGVAAMSPANMTLTRLSGEMLWPAWISSSGTRNHGAGDQSNKVGAALGSLSKKRRVGLAVDSARCLHLYVDGQDQGIAARNMPDPCYAMFDMRDSDMQKITALPVTALPQ